jgi:hypothetical protein
VVYRLYALLTLDLALDDSVNCNSNDHELIASIAAQFEAKMNENITVASSVELVLRTYDDIQKICMSPTNDNYLDGVYRPLKTAFGWRPWPNLFFCVHPEYDRMAEKLRVCLAARGLMVSPSDLKKRLLKNDGVLGSQDIIEISGVKEFDSKEIEELLKSPVPRFLDQSPFEIFAERVFWYKEWDHTLADYLHNCVRVLERNVSAAKNDFYQQVLKRHDILIKRMRRAFELLKPEGLTILRQWVEGDEFDYRALLDYAVDKKAGIMPSDRLYMKRMKQQRDVAVLLLVDLSHSTSSLASGSRASVLDVEKEGIVIFSEALDAVGDSFAVAGFSGTGRLGVDFYWLKNFEEEMNNTVRHRIDAIVPQRNTRMGAAIRHAASRLEKLPSKVRLLIILGDGFPNDIDYKQRYAIADTHQALLEARSNNIYVHAITVNIAADPKLDDLFGNVHHNVISDVCELPDRLPWIYGALTKS